MTSSVNEYKAKALECLRKAHTAHGDTRRELVNLSLAYVQLVELAEMNVAVHNALRPVEGNRSARFQIFGPGSVGSRRRSLPAIF